MLAGISTSLRLIYHHYQHYMGQVYEGILFMCYHMDVYVYSEEQYPLTKRRELPSRLDTHTYACTHNIF